MPLRTANRRDPGLHGVTRGGYRLTDRLSQRLPDLSPCRRFTVESPAVETWTADRGGAAMTSSELNSDRPTGSVSPSQGQQTIIWGDEGCSAALEVVRGMFDQSDPGSVVLRARLSEAEADAANNPRARLLLICRAPASAMQATMEEGSPPSTALKTWAASATDVLRVVRQRRRQVAVVDAGGAVRDVAALACRLSIELTTSPAAPEPAADPDPVMIAIAAEALRTDAAASALAGELAASMINLSSLKTDDADSAYLRYKVSKEEAFLLRRQLAMLQEQLESDYLNARELEAKLKTQSTELKQKQNELARRGGELKKTGAELRSAKKALERISSSKSYKMTAPLRWLRARMKRQQNSSNG